MATRYGLDGPGIEAQRGARFSVPARTGRGGHSASCMGAPFQGVKRPGRGVDHPVPRSAEVKERIELYLETPPPSSWSVLERLLLLLLLLLFIAFHLTTKCWDFSVAVTEKPKIKFCNQKHWLL